jgi:putative ABC transport system substrate-binding protein
MFDPRRRQFITLLGGAAVAWPLAARAQQPAMPVIGFIASGTPAGMAHAAAAFRSALGEAGFIEGQNVTVEYHWLEGDYNRAPALMADLVRRRVAVIATPFSQGAVAAKAATRRYRSSLASPRTRSSWVSSPASPDRAET